MDDGSEGETIEVLQQMSDPPLTHHPETGLPLRRVITSAAIAGRWSDLKAKSNLTSTKHTFFDKFRISGKKTKSFCVFRRFMSV
jgi:predicted nucleic acid-binding Zn ribbon protein